MARKKCRDDVEVTVSIPKRLLIEYVTERVSPFQPKSPCRRAFDSIVHKAVLDYYFNMFTGGDVDDSRGRGEAT